MINIIILVKSIQKISDRLSKGNARLTNLILPEKLQVYQMSEEMNRNDISLIKYHLL